MHLRIPRSPEVLIRSGRFRMGSTVAEIAAAQLQCRFEPLGAGCSASLFGDEMVSHDVLLSDFWIDRTEVTNGAYRRCVDAGRCPPPGYRAASRWRLAANKPVSLVSWREAASYCAWRGARLPSEAEWERSARGYRSRTFPWGNLYNPALSNHGRFAVNQLDSRDGFAELAPVASFSAGRTPEGVEDLAGNVEEWVADWYAQSYPEADMVDPIGPRHGDHKVVRGGSYLDGRAWLRGSSRGKAVPSSRRPWRGFRCARSARRAPKQP